MKSYFYTFMRSGSVVLITENVSDKRYRGNQNSFYFQFLPENHGFISYYGKIWYSQTDNRSKYNNAHALHAG
jgi:hypothetical protein